MSDSCNFLPPRLLLLGHYLSLYDILPQCLYDTRQVGAMLRRRLSIWMCPCIVYKLPNRNIFPYMLRKDLHARQNTAVVDNGIAFVDWRSIRNRFTI